MLLPPFDRLLDKEHPGRYYQNVEFIDTVTAPDDYTVVMTLAHALVLLKIL